MGILDSFILAGAFVATLLVAQLVGWILRRATGVSWIGRLPVWFVWIAALVVVPLSLDLFGERTTARVIERREEVRINGHGGGWYQRQRLGVQFVPRHPERADPTTRAATGDSISLQLASNVDTYDRAAIGSLVPVTYVSFRPSVARLSDRTLADLWHEVASNPELAVVGGLFAILVVGVLAARWRPVTASARWARRAVWVALACVGAALYAVIALVSPTSRHEAPTIAPAEARVVRVQRITKHWLAGRRHRRRSTRIDALEKLAQPFDVAEIEYTPPGHAAPIRAATALDTGSVRGLAPGAAVRIHFDPSAPRTVRLDGATQTFEAANRRGTVMGQLALVGTIALFLAFAMLFRRRAPARTAAIGSATPSRRMVV